MRVNRTNISKHQVQVEAVGDLHDTESSLFYITYLCILECACACTIIFCWGVLHICGQG